MYIRIYKKINSSASMKLRKAYQKIDFFSKRNNSNFLFEEFPEEDEYHIFDYIDKKDEDYSQISENMGHYSAPKYTFSKNANNNPIFSLNWDSEHIYEETFLTISFSAFKFETKKRSFKINLSAIWNKDNSYDKFGFYLQNSGETKDNIIYNIPLFFYNNRKLYERIYFSLLKNKTKMIRISGNKDFVNDLISLFSVEETFTAPIDLNISNCNKEKEFIIYDSHTFSAYNKKKSKDDFLILSYFNNSHRADSEIKGIEEVALKIGKNEDILAIDFIFGNSNSDFLSPFDVVGDMNINSIKNDERLDTFLNMYLMDWLNNYILFSDFTAEVYNKVKSKILVNSIVV